MFRTRVRVVIGSLLIFVTITITVASRYPLDGDQMHAQMVPYKQADCIVRNRQCQLVWDVGSHFSSDAIGIVVWDGSDRRGAQFFGDYKVQVGPPLPPQTVPARRRAVKH